jgi:hypothetical protein
MVAVTSLLTLQPVFTALPQFSLNASVLGGVGGTLERQPDQTLYYRDTVVKLTARPATGYVFQTWLDNIQANPRTVVMASNVTLFAVFAPGQPQPPVITVQPQDATVVVGDRAQFTAVAQGSTPLEYQWQKNGVNLAEASQPTYTIGQAQLADGGSYRVVASNSAGSATSVAAKLTVLTAPPYVNRVLALDGQSACVTVPSSPDLQNPEVLTVEAWVFPVLKPQNHNPHFLSKGDGLTVSSSRSYELAWTADGKVNFSLFANQSTWALVSAPAPERVWTHIAVTFDSIAGWLRLYTNGVLAMATTDAVVGQAALQGQKLRQTSLPLVLGAYPPHPGTFAAGCMDEVRVWNKARRQQEIAQTMYCKLSGAETSLAAYWNFDDGGAKDLTRRGHSGALVASATAAPIEGEDLVHRGPCGPQLWLDPGSLRMDPESGLRFSIASSVTGTVRIEASTNLLEWAPVVSVPVWPGLVEFTDPLAKDHPSRFYRAVLP